MSKQSFSYHASSSKPSAHSSQLYDPSVFVHFLDSSQVPAISVWKNNYKESNLNRMKINPALLYIHFYQHRRHYFFHNLDRIFYSLLALEIPTKVAFVVFFVLICPVFYSLFLALFGFYAFVARYSARAGALSFWSLLTWDKKMSGFSRWFLMITNYAIIFPPLIFLNPLLPKSVKWYFSRSQRARASRQNEEKFLSARVAKLFKKGLSCSWNASIQGFTAWTLWI